MYKRKSNDENKQKERMEKLEQLVPNGKKKWVRYEEGAMLYSVGLHTFEKLAKDANAIYHVGRIVLINTEKIDEYMDLMCADDPE